jgi:F420-0:gamma-glutamyl ligase
MKIIPVKTRLIRAGECSAEEFITESITELEENSILAVSSKAIALCQNRVVDTSTITKADLIKREAEFYTSEDFNKYGFNFTILHNTLIASAGIDESNTDGFFVLWPEDPQQTANELRAFIRTRFNVKNIGVIITDSSSMPPMRAGAIGILLAHSGFLAVKQLAGTSDLFGRKFKVSQSAIGSGLAAATNVVMGEGAEQTPIALISELPFVTFQSADPTPEELVSVYLDPQMDLYAPFIQSAPWKRGGKELTRQRITTNPMQL